MESKITAINLSKRTYNLAIGGIVAYGLILNALMCHFLSSYFTTWNPIVILIGYFVLAIGGIALTTSDSALISFIGYNIVVVPVGVVLSIILSANDISPKIIYDAVLETAIIVLIMTALGFIFPNFFLSLGKTLFTCLSIFIIVSIVLCFLNITEPSWFNLIGCGIFSMYIAHDWADANKLESTLDNAVDMATGLYLDITNLFLKILDK